MKKSKAFFLRVLVLICVGVVLVSLYNIFLQYSEYKSAVNEYEKLSEITQLDDGIGDVYEEQIDFKALREINPDIVGWISVDNININYPIVQAYDNEFYLSVTYTGTSNSSGAIFLDCRNSANFIDRNNIIYGHMMKNGTMFASLTEYKSQSFYEAHPFFMIYTPDASYRCEVFAAYVTPSVSATYVLDFEGANSFTKYIETAINNSLIATDITPGSSDKIVTLSTCDYTYDDARMVVQARMITV